MSRAYKSRYLFKCNEGDFSTEPDNQMKKYKLEGGVLYNQEIDRD